MFKSRKLDGSVSKVALEALQILSDAVTLGWNPPITFTGANYWTFTLIKCDLQTDAELDYLYEGQELKYTVKLLTEKSNYKFKLKWNGQFMNEHGKIEEDDDGDQSDMGQEYITVTTKGSDEVDILTEEKYRSQLVRAVQNGDFKTVVQTFTDCPSLTTETRDKQGKTLLMVASQLGHVDIVKHLLGMKASALSTTQSGKTPFLMACASGQEAVLQCYIRHFFTQGIDAMDHIVGTNSTIAPALVVQNLPDNVQDEVMKLLTRSDSGGSTPLMWACDNNHINIASLLLRLEKIVNPSVTTVKLASHSQKRLSIFVNLADLNLIRSEDRSGNTPLHRACCSTSTTIALLEVLLSNGAKSIINQRNKLRQTPLLQACLVGNVASVQTLLLHGADVRITNSHGYGCRDLAEGQEHSEIVGILDKFDPNLIKLHAGAKINLGKEDTDLYLDSVPRSSQDKLNTDADTDIKSFSQSFKKLVAV